jgi:hypothetical protein
MLPDCEDDTINSSKHQSFLLDDMMKFLKGLESVHGRQVT